MPLMTSGRALKPFSFQRKSGQELRFDRNFNLKAGMTMGLFFAWL